MFTFDRQKLEEGAVAVAFAFFPAALTLLPILAGRLLGWST